jgi:hypothetical protein
MEKERKNHQLRKELFVQHRILSAVKSFEFVSDGMSYIDIRIRWCNNIVLNEPDLVRGNVMNKKTESMKN